MSCMSNLRDHFASLPAGMLVSRQDVLDFGSMGAVDMSLTRLVKERTIERIAIGVYTKIAYPMPVFTAEQVAAVKTRVFKKTLAAHHSTFKNVLLNTEAPRDDIRTFATDRCTSKFWFNEKYVHLKIVTGRMASLPATKTGEALQALWSVGSENVDTDIVSRICESLDEAERAALFSTDYSIPYWLRTAIFEAA